MQKNAFNDQSTREEELLFRRSEWIMQMLSVLSDKLGRGQMRDERTIRNLKLKNMVR